VLQDLSEKKDKVSQASGHTQRIQDDLAKIKLSIYETDYNNMKQERAIQMLEKMINSQEIKNPEQLSDSYLKLSKWHFDFKDQQVKHQVPV
jgi:hypothetical protein